MTTTDPEPVDSELIPFPFDGPFACQLHARHPAGCAIADPTHRLDAPFVPLLPLASGGDSDSGLLRDDAGRIRIYRGVNVCYKLMPYTPLVDAYHPSLSCSRAELRLFARLGINAIRLGVPWAAVQPRRPDGLDDDGFDYDYLRAVRRFVDDAASEGLVVLLSGHQDLYAPRFMGNGMPNWSITSSFYTMAFPRPVRLSAATYNEGQRDGMPDWASIGLNDKNQDDWGYFYVSDAVARAFWGFYVNEGGIRNMFCDAWGKVAEAVVGATNVFGYEILNEPFLKAATGAGAAHAFAFSTYYDATERDALLPLYHAVHDAIRAHDRRGLVLFEPVTGNSGGDGFTPSSAPLLGDDPAGAARSIFAYHLYYTNKVNGHMGGYRGQVQTRFKQAKRMGVGTIVTEWDMEAKPHRYRELNFTFDLCESHGLSHFGWQYKDFLRVCGSPAVGSLIDPTTGWLRRAQAAIWSRPYAEAVAGTFVEQRYDPAHRAYTLRFRIRAGVTAPTVLRVSEDAWAYAEGFDVAIEPADAATIARRPPHRVEVYTTASMSAGLEVRITIRPRRSAG